MLSALPQELIAKVFQCLLDSPRDYQNLSRTCKKLCGIASNFTNRTALSFNFDLDLEFYSEVSCESHGQCPNLRWTKEGCEQQLAKRRNLISRMKERNSWHEKLRDLNPAVYCYYHRIYCMLHAEHTTFSIVRFDGTSLLHSGCLMAFETSPQPHKLNALAELEISDCFVTLEWLATILEHLKNLDYLTLNSPYFEAGSNLRLDINLEGRNRKVLKRLRIISMRNQVNDSEFKFLVENCPAIELDLTITRIEDRPMVLQRFYGSNRSDQDIWTRPSKHILSFNMVYLYLSRHKNVLRRFRADKTSFRRCIVQKILDEMRDLHVSCLVDDIRFKKDLDEFREHLAPRDVKRVELISHLSSICFY